MKNKKLFAILTLVCFMFTLMPMAAFAAAPTYAEVADDYVKDNEKVYVELTNATTDSYYVFAVNDATNKVYRAGIVEAAVEDKVVDGDVVAEDAVELAIAVAGTYNMYVVDITKYTQGVMTRYENAEITLREAADLLIGASTVVMLDSEVVVKSTAPDYVITLVKAIDINKADVIDEDGNVLVGADSGFDEVEVTVQLNEATVDADDKVVVGKAVVGATLDVDTNSYVIDVDKAEVKTNAAGQATFVVSASTAGNFEVYVEYGSKADLEIPVVAGALDAAVITTIAEPTAPVALDSDLDATTGIWFSITDANGNAVNAIDADDYRVVTVDAPKGADIDDKDLKVKLGTKGWYLTGTVLDEEGDYTFKVILDNGDYATAKVTVKEFIKPVALKLAYPTNTVELGGEIEVAKLVYVDVNGVEKAAKDVELSASGYAVADFEADGTISVEENEKYVGSTIKVIAVSEKYNLVANVELTVANEAAGVKYANTNADVAVNNSLVANVVDEDGNKVALSGTVEQSKYQIQYIVLDKPADAKVAISTKSTVDLLSKGQFVVSFTASAAGEYKVQTVVRVETEEEVVKYYSGTETITVGNTGIKDVVVMSIGSDQIIINNKVEKMLCEAVIKDGRTMVPFRAGLEALGATVDYDQATQSVIAEMNGTKVVMTLGEKAYTVNGVAKVADVAPYLNVEASTTMVPASFVANEFGINVDYTTNPDGTVADVLFAN